MSEQEGKTCGRCGAPLDDNDGRETCAYCDLEAAAFELRTRSIANHLEHQRLLIERRERNRF